MTSGTRMEAQCDIVILAAGSSSRLGSPKQLLLYKQNSLLQHAIKQATASSAREVVVVLGASASSIKPIIENNRIVFITNDHWQEGMASSIRCGLEYLLHRKTSIKSLLFMTCDQPFINSVLLNKLIALQIESGQSIIASEYGGIIGTPAIFAASLFHELLQLTGDTGAKKIMMLHPEKVATVSFPLGHIDIDTVADYDELKKM